MTLDPFNQRNGCTCRNTVAMARAAIDGQPMPLCALHDVAAIRQRDQDERVEKMERALAMRRVAIDEARAALNEERTPKCTCRGLAEGLAAALSGDPPAPCIVHTSTTTAADNSPLNTPALPNKLAALLGVDSTTPPDAA